MLRSLTAAAIVLSPAASFAYEIKTTDSGEHIRWPSGDIELQLVLGDAPDGISKAQADAATAAAAASWQGALEGSDVSMTVNVNGSATQAGDGIPSVRWAREASDPGIETGRLAVTALSYRVSDGVIQDADVVVNAAEYHWTVSEADCTDAYDLEGSLAHEFGHLLGLGHSLEREATMFATGSKCEIVKRDLAEDDMEAIFTLYGAETPAGLGVQGEPDVAPAYGCAAGGSAGGSSVLLVAAALIGVSRRRSRTAAVALAVAGVAAASTPASAAQLRRVALDELASHAELVVRGVVVATRPAPGEAIATDSEVRVTECLAGRCPATVQVRRRGGEVGDRGLWVDGEAELRPGEEVILYLRPHADRVQRVIGGVQGVLRMVVEAGRVHAVRDLRAHRVLVGGVWTHGDLERIELADVRRSLGRFRAAK